MLPPPTSLPRAAQAPADQELHRLTDHSRLDDRQSLAELGIATDDVLALTLKQEGSSPPAACMGCGDAFYRSPLCNKASTLVPCCRRQL